jgi:pimeloyl-ACP methyl ester carboxylesterase
LARDGRIELVVLPAGHWVHVDDGEGLARALLAFVGRDGPAHASEVGT